MATVVRFSVLTLLMLQGARSQLTCEDKNIPYTFRPSVEAQGSTDWKESWFIVIGTAGVRPASFGSANGCASGQPTCYGNFRRETFYFGANRFTEHTGLNISTLFFDHCYAEDYLVNAFLSLFLQTQPTVTLYDKNCTKYSIPHRQFRLIISDLSSEITSKVVELSRLLKAPQLAFGAASEWLDDEERYPYLLRYVPSTKYEAKYILELAKRLDVSSLVLFYSLTAYGISGKQQIVKQAPDFGITIKYYPVSRDNHSNFNKTLKRLLEDTSFISNPCIQMGFIGEESYHLSPLLNGINPIGNDLDTMDWLVNKKRIIAGAGWTPNHFLHQGKDAVSCLDKLTSDNVKNQYFLLKGSMVVGLPLNNQLLGNGLCHYLASENDDVAMKCAKLQVEATDIFLQNIFSAWWDAWAAIGRHNDHILYVNQSRNLFEKLKLRKQGEGNFANVNYDIYEFNDDGTMEINGSVKIRGDKFLGSFPYPNNQQCQKSGMATEHLVETVQVIAVILLASILLLSVIQITVVGYLIRWLRNGVRIREYSDSSSQNYHSLSFLKSKDGSRRNTLLSANHSEIRADDGDSGVDNAAASVGESFISSLMVRRPDGTVRHRMSGHSSPVSVIDPYRLSLQPPGLSTPLSSSSYPFSIMTSSMLDPQISAPSHDGGRVLMSAV